MPAPPPLRCFLFRHYTVFTSSLIAILVGCGRDGGWQRICLAIAALQVELTGLQTLYVSFSLHFRVQGHFSGTVSVFRGQCSWLLRHLTDTLLLTLPPPLWIWRMPSSPPQQSAGVNLFTFKQSRASYRPLSRITSFETVIIPQCLRQQLAELVSVCLPRGGFPLRPGLLQKSWQKKMSN